MSPALTKKIYTPTARVKALEAAIKAAEAVTEKCEVELARARRTEQEYRDEMKQACKDLYEWALECEETSGVLSLGS